MWQVQCVCHVYGGRWDEGDGSGAELGAGLGGRERVVPGEASSSGRVPQTGAVGVEPPLWPAQWLARVEQPGSCASTGPENPSVRLPAGPARHPEVR